MGGSGGWLAREAYRRIPLEVCKSPLHLAIGFHTGFEVYSF